MRLYFACAEIKQGGYANCARALMRVAPQLKRRGVSFVSSADEADLVWLYDKQLRDRDTGGKPLIVHDLSDYTAVSNGARALLARTDVVSLVKLAVLDPPELNNHPHFFDTYHYVLMREALSAGRGARIPERLRPLSIGELAKIEPAWNYAQYYGAPQAADAASVASPRRPLAAHFAGRAGGKTLAENYRTLATAALARCRLPHFLKACASPREHLSRNDYRRTMKSACCVVSPWGQGEYCWRDYEAIASGCVLVKPDSSFCRSWPDLLAGDGPYVRCANDFSDLCDTVERIYDRWDELAELRCRANRLVEFAWDAENFADHVQGILIRATERAR